MAKGMILDIQSEFAFLSSAMMGVLYLHERFCKDVQFLTAVFFAVNILAEISH